MDSQGDSVQELQDAAGALEVRLERERGDSLYKAGRATAGGRRGGREEPGAVGGFYGAEKGSGWGGLEVKMRSK